MAARQLDFHPARFGNLSGIPVFTYHGIAHSEIPPAPSRERKYWVTMKAISGHMRKAHQLNYKVMNLGQAWRTTDADKSPSSSAVITFDDGLESAYNLAFPLLVAQGVSADFFINTATIDRRGFLSWTQIREMYRHGMSFQSHSHEHVYLTWLSEKDLENQLARSKDIIQNKLCCAVSFLSVPYGDVNPRVVEVALRVGYRAVCTSREWTSQPGERTVNRVVVYNHTTVESFGRLLVGCPAAYWARVASATARSLPKRMLLGLLPSPPPQGVSIPENRRETAT